MGHEQTNCFKIFEGRLLSNCKWLTLCKKVCGPNDYKERNFFGQNYSLCSVIAHKPGVLGISTSQDGLSSGSLLERLLEV